MATRFTGSHPPAGYRELMLAEPVSTHGMRLPVQETPSTSPCSGPVQRLDDGVSDHADKPLDRFRVARHERSRSDLLGELLQVELARGANEGHRVVHHRHAPSLEHLAEDDTQWTGPRPLLQIVDRLVAQEQGIELVHGDPFGVARLDAFHEARERVESVKVRSVSPAHQLSITLAQLDVPDPDVPDLVAAL